MADKIIRKAYYDPSTGFSGGPKNYQYQYQHLGLNAIEKNQKDYYINI